MAQGRAAGRSFQEQIKSLEQDLDLLRDEVLRGLADEIIIRSPVDSGAYVRGHQAVAGRSAGGQFTGNLVSNPTSANPEAEREIGRNNLYADIEALPKEATNVSFNNRVPHASKVEYSGWSNTGPYMVYKGAASRFPAILQEVKSRLGFR
jgi:hypothetical protein